MTLDQKFFPPVEGVRFSLPQLSVLDELHIQPPMEEAVKLQRSSYLMLVSITETEECYQGVYSLRLVNKLSHNMRMKVFIRGKLYFRTVVHNQLE